MAWIGHAAWIEEAIPVVQSPTAPSRTYVLGHSDQELERIIQQARFFDDVTAALLREAGLAPGMRVLDVGCGAGDVSLLAASIVGPEGTVNGVDTSPEAVELASRRAAAAGLTNVHFQVRNAVDLVLEDRIDAVVGRFILMYFADPAVVLRRLASFVKPGGVIVFQELDMRGATSAPACPTFETAVQRIRHTFSRAGIDDRTGLALPRIFREAGLPAPRMLLGARVEAGPDSPIYAQISEVTRTLQPLMLATGMAGEDDIGVETLADRIREEAVALDATLVSPSLIGAWTRVGSRSNALETPAR